MYSCVVTKRYPHRKLRRWKNKSKDDSSCFHNMDPSGSAPHSCPPPPFVITSYDLVILTRRQRRTCLLHMLNHHLQKQSQTLHSSRPHGGFTPAYQFIELPGPVRLKMIIFLFLFLCLSRIAIAAVSSTSTPVVQPSPSKISTAWSMPSVRVVSASTARSLQVSEWESPRWSG